MRKALASLQAVPNLKTFPIRNKQALDETCRNFSNPNRVRGVKQELLYVCKNVNLEEWLKHVISDRVVATYHKALDIMHLNFITYVIGKLIFNSSCIKNNNIIP